MGNSSEFKSIDLKNIGLKTTLPRLKILNLFEQSSIRHLSAEPEKAKSDGVEAK